MKSRGIALLISLFMVLAMAAPASAQRREGVRLLTAESATVLAGESVWLAFNWTSRSSEVSQFAATVTAPSGIVVEYPTNTATFTGLQNGHFLSPGEIDYTAIKVTVPHGVDEEFDIGFTVTYLDANGNERGQRFRAEIVVDEYEGSFDVIQHESSTSLPSGTGRWVDVDYTTRAPRVDDFVVVLTDAGGLPYSYPAGGSHTSLHHDDRLSRGETDTARFYVDAEGMDPGQYTLLTETSYSIDRKTLSMAGKVSVTVTAAEGE